MARVMGNPFYYVSDTPGSYFAVVLSDDNLPF